MEVFLGFNQIFPIISASQGVFFLMAGLIFLIIGLSALLFSVWLKMTRLQKKLDGHFSARFFPRSKNGADQSDDGKEKDNYHQPTKISIGESTPSPKAEEADEKEKPKKRSFRQFKGVRNTQGFVTFKSMDENKDSPESKANTRKKIILDQPPTPRPTKKAMEAEKSEPEDPEVEEELALEELWFYTTKEQEFGPVPENELKSLIERAALDNDSFIRRASETQSSEMTDSAFSDYYFSHGYFKFRCPVCGQKIKSRFNWAGRRHNCPGCSTALLIPVYNPDSDSIAAEA